MDQSTNTDTESVPPVNPTILVLYFSLSLAFFIAKILERSPFSVLERQLVFAPKSDTNMINY